MKQIYTAYLSNLAFSFDDTASYAGSVRHVNYGTIENHHSNSVAVGKLASIKLYSTKQASASLSPLPLLSPNPVGDDDRWTSTAVSCTPRSQYQPNAWQLYTLVLKQGD
jgi:hypothetical protein